MQVRGTGFTFSSLSSISQKFINPLIVRFLKLFNVSHLEQLDQLLVIYYCIPLPGTVYLVISFGSI